MATKEVMYVLQAWSPSGEEWVDIDFNAGKVSEERAYEYYENATKTFPANRYRVVRKEITTTVLTTDGEPGKWIHE